MDWIGRGRVGTGTWTMVEVVINDGENDEK
jgi:hypothetical protein